MKTSRTLSSRFFRPQNFFEFVFLQGIISMGTFKLLFWLGMRMIWPNYTGGMSYSETFFNCFGFGLFWGLFLWLLLCVFPAKFAKYYPNAEQNEDEIKK